MQELKTHHRPRCPPACRRGPSSAPQGTNSQGCQRSLTYSDNKQKIQNVNSMMRGHFFKHSNAGVWRQLQTTAKGPQPARLWRRDRITCPHITPLIIWPCRGERGSRSLGHQPRRWPRRELVSVSESFCYNNTFAKSKITRSFPPYDGGNRL